jgi:single-stranded-DNA-specific exonuclease
VRFGVDAMQSAPNPGVRRLLERTRLLGKRIQDFDVSFRIAPMLNALGRMGEASDAARLFLTDRPEEVDQVLDRAEQSNRERQKVEQSIVAEAIRQLEGKDLDEHPALVLAGDSWHPGVVGIVASRLVDRYQRPAAVLAVDGDQAKGSIRTTGGFDLSEAIDRCRERIPELKGGGHAQAAGVTLPRSGIRRFREAFQALAREGLPEDRRPTLRVDDEVEISQIERGLCKEMMRLSPHGAGNPAPLLAARGLSVAGPPRIMKEKHVAFQLSDGRRSIRAVAFNRPKLGRQLKKWERVDVAFVPKLNETYSPHPEMMVRDVTEAPPAG